MGRCFWSGRAGDLAATSPQLLSGPRTSPSGHGFPAEQVPSVLCSPLLRGYCRRWSVGGHLEGMCPPRPVWGLAGSLWPRTDVPAPGLLLRSWGRRSSPHVAPSAGPQPEGGEAWPGGGSRFSLRLCCFRFSPFSRQQGPVVVWGAAHFLPAQPPGALGSWDLWVLGGGCTWSFLWFIPRSWPKCEPGPLGEIGASHSCSGAWKRPQDFLLAQPFLPPCLF